MKVDGLQFDAKALRQYYAFLAERQNIWHKRFILKEKPPWTDSKLLQNHKFCNVYRELDRGTLFVTEDVYGRENTADVYFRVLLYRLFNEIDTYKALYPILGRFTVDAASKILLKRQESGQSVFRNAWLSAGTGLHGRGSKIVDYLKAAEEVYKDRRNFAKAIEKSGSMKAAWEIVKKIKWMGGFIAYQVVLDYSYLGLPGWAEDTWVYIGPGAKKGVFWLRGEILVNNADLVDLLGVEPVDFDAYVRHLQSNQDTYFSRYKLDFKRWNSKPLDVHNIQFTLCEFNKFKRADFGGKKKKFIYQEGEQ